MLHGDTIIVKTGATPVAIAKQRTMTLIRTCEMRETASNTSDSQEFTTGRKGWTLQVSGLMSARSEVLQEGSLYNITIDYGSSTESGQAYCQQVEITGVIGSLAQQTCSFQGTGALTLS